MKTKTKAARVAAGCAVAVAMAGSAVTGARAEDVLSRASATVGDVATYRLNVSDLDLGTREGKAAYEARVDAFIRKACDQETMPQNGELFLGDFAGCVHDLRAHADRNLNEQLAEIARRNGVALASGDFKK